MPDMDSDITRDKREEAEKKLQSLIADSLNGTELEEKDKERMRDLQAQLSEENISKNKKKKLAKEIEWVANRKKRNAQKKAERKGRRKAISDGSEEPKQKRAKIVKMAHSNCRIRVALDMALSEFMTKAEMTKTTKQVQRCYALNRRSENPVQLHLTGLLNAEYFSKNVTALDNWDIHKVDVDHAEYFGKEKAVYLTGDSENEIEELAEDEAYIIGAMVDHNRHKGITHKRAVEAGVRHARLPLDKYIDLKTRKVLTIDHCFQIVLRRANGVPWKDAILEAIPARKGAQAKGDVSNDEDSEDHGEDGADETGENEETDGAHGDAAEKEVEVEKTGT